MADARDSTKNRILDNAFALYAETWEKDVSLSQIAARTGISKTAIFRHFADKDALLAAMKKRFYDAAAVCAAGLHSGGALSVDRIGDAVAGMCRRPVYLMFMLRLLSCSPSFHEEFEREVKKRGVVFSSPAGGRFDFFLREVYAASMALTFAINYAVRNCPGAVSADLPEASLFADRAALLLRYGWKGMRLLSAADMERLSLLCRVDSSLLGEEDRFFTALANIIGKYGIQELTVDRFAEELHIAKSSLYSYSRNKKELLRSVIAEEVQRFADFRRNKALAAADFGEGVFLLMASMMEYLFARPNLLPVLGWLRMRDAMCMPSLRNDSAAAVLERLAGECGAELPAVLDMQAIVGWIESLIEELVVCGRKNGYSDETLRSVLPVIYGFVCTGLEKNEGGSAGFLGVPEAPCRSGAVPV